MENLIISSSSSSSFVSPSSHENPPPTLQQRLHFHFSPPKPSETERLSSQDPYHPSNKTLPIDDEVTAAKWFYSMSLTQSFSAGDGVPRKSFSLGSLVWLCGGHQLQFYNCERAKEAQIHGIETFVCFPTCNGVVELGSSDVIKENWGLVQQAKSLFGSDLPKQRISLEWFESREI